MAKRRDDWLVKAGQAWEVLVKAAARRELVTYKQVGDAIDLHHRVMSIPLGIIRDYCLEERLPVLASLVVSKSKNVPGKGYFTPGVGSVDEAQLEVFDHHWGINENPFVQFNSGENFDRLINDIINDPNKAGDIYVRVRRRGIAQQIFRRVVTRVYNFKCAMCGLSFLEALDAAHIVPWSHATPQQRMDPRNGLLLCATHHKLFDADWITVTESYRISYVDPQKKMAPTARPMLKSLRTYTAES